MLFAVPKRLRYSLHDDADLQGAVLRIFLALVERCLGKRGRCTDSSGRPANDLSASFNCVDFALSGNAYYI